MTIEMKKQNNKAIVIILGMAAIALIIGLSGCGGSTAATNTVTTTTVTVTAPPTPCTQQDTIDTVVANYNELLVSQGSDPIQPGLRCTLYNVPSMPSNPCLLSSSIAGCNVVSSSSGYVTVGSWTYNGAFNQQNQVGTSGFNILPTALQSLYSTNFAVTCSGYFVSTDDNYHEFDVVADDGALVYFGGALVLNNDGEHAAKDVTAEKYMQAQVYTFQLNYFQGPGYVELVLNEDGNVIPAGNFYH